LKYFSNEEIIIAGGWNQVGTSELSLVEKYNVLTGGSTVHIYVTYSMQKCQVLTEVTTSTKLKPDTIID